MAGRIEALLKLAELVRGLGSIIDLAALGALARAAWPLPKSDADVDPWLARLGISAPLAPVAHGILAKILPDIPAPQLAYASPGDAARALPSTATLAVAVRDFRAACPEGVAPEDVEIVEKELVAAAIPVWVIPAVLEIIKLLSEWIRSRRTA